MTLIVRALMLLVQVTAATSLNCSSSVLSTLPPFGAQIQNLTATPVSNFTIYAAQNGATPPFNTNFQGLDLCNVTVTYNHLGRDDTVHVHIWLPLTNWNGKLQAVGGGGWDGGNGSPDLAAAVALGYAAAETDAGHPETYFDPKGADPGNWALDGPGNVDLDLLQDFAATTLSDLAFIAKAVTKSFYGTQASRSYFSGCSGGGRQGLMLAQRYPTAFDGILAMSPAIHWDKLPISTYWPQQVMNNLSYYPLPCELEAITKEATAACDLLDGVADGVISLPSLCKFDARSLIGESFNCSGNSHTFSYQAAAIANAAWRGPQSPDGELLWHGVNKDALLAGWANTTCAGSTANTCTGVPFSIGSSWITYFVAKRLNFPINQMSNVEYASIFRSSVQEYESIIGTSDPDLSQFRALGGKMITTHGLADPVIPVNSTADYYQNVLSFDPRAADFYRFFEAPGIGHCGYGIGHQAVDPLTALVKWVEDGEAPDFLTAASQSPAGDMIAEKEGGSLRLLCPYPKMQRYVGGDITSPESYKCF